MIRRILGGLSRLLRNHLPEEDPKVINTHCPVAAPNFVVMYKVFYKIIGFVVRVRVW
jgi:hypothetical protein